MSSIFKSERSPIILNKRYGGYCYSKKAVDEYNKRKQILDNNFKPIHYDLYIDYNEIGRKDPIMIDIIKEIGIEASHDKCSKLEIIYVIKDFENYVEICDQDGYEDFEYNLENYKINEITNIVNLIELDSNEKIKKIKNILNKKSIHLYD